MPSMWRRPQAKEVELFPVELATNSKTPCSWKTASTHAAIRSLVVRVALRVSSFR